MCLLIVRPTRVSLVVRVDFDDRAELLAAAPDVYYVTDHYLDYNTVLVRLSRVTPQCPAGFARHGSQVRERANGAHRHRGAAKTCGIPPGPWSADELSIVV